MGSLDTFYKTFVILSAFVLASAFWYAEVRSASLYLTWTATSDNEDNFKIERLGAGLVEATMTVPARVTSYVDTGLVSGSIYCYRVEASNAAGSSAPSNQACATAQDSIENVNEDQTPVTSDDAFSRSTGSAVLFSLSGTNKVEAPSTLQAPNKWTDYDLTVKLGSMNSGSIGVMFRYQDDKNYYRFAWNQKSKFRRLEKVKNGKVMVLANDDVAYVTGQTYQLEIVVHGPVLRVLLDGSHLFFVTDPSFVDGTVGLYSSGNPGSFFDDLAVKDLATGITLLSDSFDSRNFTGWTIVDQSVNQGPSVWSATGGTLTQSSNANETFALYTLRNWTDSRFTVKMKSLDRDSIGVMFRYQDSNNYYRFSWNTRQNFRRLEKCRDGIFTLLAQDSTGYVPGQTYQVAVVAKGPVLEVAIDGRTVFSVEDASFNEGTVALYSDLNRSSIFDDVLVEDLTTGAVLLQDAFTESVRTGWTIVDDKGATHGPSVWSVQGGALVQTSEIDSSANINLGTYALY